MPADPIDCLDRRALLRSAFLIVGGIGLAPEVLAQGKAGSAAAAAQSGMFVAAVCQPLGNDVKDVVHAASPDVSSRLCSRPIQASPASPPHSSQAI